MTTCPDCGDSIDHLREALLPLGHSDANDKVNVIVCPECSTIQKVGEPKRKNSGF